MKKIIAMLTAIVMCVLIIVPFSVSAGGNWQPPLDADFWTGEGVRARSFTTINETAKTITINSEAELGLLSYNVFAGSPYKGWVISLSKNLDLSAHKWISIGTSDTYFAGTFDGKGFEIKNLNFKETNYNSVGLFGTIDYSSTIKNLTVSGNIDCSKWSVGGIVCCNFGTIENCINNVNITWTIDNRASVFTSRGGVAGLNWGTIKNCVNNGNLDFYYNCGGITGVNNYRIESCTNNGKVHATIGECGGIAGINDKIIINSNNCGPVSTNAGVVGGIAATNDGTLENCRNSNVVKADTTYSYNQTYLGGIAGKNDKNGIITKCSNTGSVVGDVPMKGDITAKNDGTVISTMSSIMGARLNTFIRFSRALKYSK